MVGSRIAVVSLVCYSVAAQAQGDPPRKDVPFAEQLRGLDPKNDKAVRLNTIRRINEVGARNAGLAVPALERCIRNDPEGEVRQRAVNALSSLAHRLKRPCPLAVAEALRDPVDLVRWEAAAWAGTFKSFAAGSAEALLRGVSADKADARSTCLLLLGRVAGNDPKAIDAMNKATKDKVFDVRHSAHIALFTAKNKLDEYLPYLIRFREDPASVLTPAPPDSKLAKQERAQRNMFLLGIAMQMMEWSETRADELAAVLMKLLGDKSALMRRGAANLIAASAVKVELAAPRKGNPFDLAGTWKDGGSSAILPYIDPEAAAKEAKKTPPKKRPQKSKVALCLEKLKVEDRLRNLRNDDPDRSVREAARRALERLAALNEKKP
jgi:hypothetical protein